ncbi:serine/threonine-protein kinase [Hyphomonas chukchiensis]|uniref:serine/threonine-protein kinase n=1 Tax=Hyphomonas chukchiensis TaxID=1280947 RepID=UPI0030F8C9F3
MKIDAFSDWSRVDAAFTAALELPESTREAWLQNELSDAPDMLRLATRLLRRERESQTSFDELTSLRDMVLSDIAAGMDDPSGDPRIGARYGHWRVVRRIGSGGLSVVYEAKRADGRYEQTVALKVIRGGMQSADIIRHFLRERQILSTLDHPGIVRILDGGETATGAPWLVMDMALGQSITSYCDTAGLGLYARMSLVADVADAAQSAHSKLVVHRDIKPDNIIVSRDGHARLLDFGVSSLADGVNDPGGIHAMTPEYASPEQLRLEATSTASDIYQLGRVLAELCEPFSQSADVKAVIARATADVATVRYSSAASFANDLRRVIDGRAPEAKPDTRLEASLRLIRRNKILTALSAVLLAGLAGWGITLSIYTKEVEHQRTVAIAAADRADRGKGVLLDIFRRLDPLEQDGISSSVATSVSLLEPTVRDVRERLPDDPALQAELIGWVARAKERSDETDEANALASEAVALLASSGDRTSTTYAAALAYRGALDIDLGNREEGETLIKEALTIARSAPISDEEALDTFLSAAWSKGSDWISLRALFEEALPRALATGSVEAEIEVRSGLGRALGELGELSEAEAQISQAIALTESIYGADHPRLALPLSDMGRILNDMGRSEESIATHRRALAISSAAFGPDNSSTLSHQNNLALALLGAGRSDEAITLFEMNLASRIRTEGADSLDAGELLQNLAVTQSQAGRVEDALVSLARAEAIFDVRLAEGNPRRAFPALTRSAILLDMKTYGEAERNARRAYDILSKTLPAGHYATEVARCRIGMARLGLGDRKGARSYLEPSLAALASQTGAPAAYVEACKAAGRELELPAAQ